MGQTALESTISPETLTSAAVSGSMISGLGAIVGQKLIGTGLEFGTVPMPEVIAAMLADQWLHNHGTLASAQGRAIKTEMERVFYPPSDE